MTFDPAATHAMWTRETDRIFRDFINRAKWEFGRFENEYVDSEGKVDVGAVVHLLVTSYADGHYKIIREVPRLVPVKESTDTPETLNDAPVVITTSDSSPSSLPEEKPKKKPCKKVEKDTESTI